MILNKWFLLYIYIYIHYYILKKKLNYIIINGLKKKYDKDY